MAALDSRQHAFNRYEIKYLVATERLGRLRTELARRLDPDQHGEQGGYGVWSVYYDAADLRFYWEKIDGIRFRRKLRIRHYGQPGALRDETPVYVEIKQRIGRATQKRRIAMAYRAATAICDRRAQPDDGEAAHGFLAEVLGLVTALDLRPVVVTGYQRTALVGRDGDNDLRVTLDQRVRGRDRDLHLGAEAQNRLIVPARLSIVEVKANERVPTWLTDLAARENLTAVRVSKYCQCVEAYGMAPRSAFNADGDEG